MSKTSLPAGWVNTRLGDVLADLRNGTTARQNKDGHGVRVTRIEAVQGGAIDHSRLGYVSEPKGLERFAYEAGDIAFSHINSFEHVGKVAAIDESDLPMLAGMNLLRLRARVGIDPKWLFWTLCAPQSRTAVRRDIKRAVNQVSINQKQLNGIAVLLPPLNEQRRIVQAIEDLQARSAAAKAALDAIPPLLEKFRQSVLASAFRGDLTKAWRAENPDVEPASVLLTRIRAERRVRWIEAAAEKGRARAEAKARKGGKYWSEVDDGTVLARERVKAEKKYVAPDPVDVEGLPELPEGWCWARMDEVSASRGYGTAKKSHATGDLPVLRMGNLQNGEIDWNGLKFSSDDEDNSKYLLAPNTVLFNRTNSPAWVGKTAIYRGERPAIFAGYLIRIDLLAGVHPDFVNLLLNSPFGRVWCWQVKSDGVSQSNISGSKLATFPVPLCPVAEQDLLVHRVREQFEAADGAARAHASAVAEVGCLNQSILAKAFRGELVPQDPTDEPASVLLDRIHAERAAAEAAKPKKKRRPRRPKKASEQGEQPGVK